MAPPDTDLGPKRVAVFLDRDGVINRRVPGDYVRTRDEFEMLPGVPGALAQIARSGATAFVVTNQRGVARGLVQRAELDEIHEQLACDVTNAGARLGGIYVCPHEIGTCSCRKPDVGLFIQARDAHPWIRFDESHMVGDSLADLEAGQRLDMRLWLVGSERRAVAREANQLGIRLAGSADSLADLVANEALIAELAAA